MQILKKIIVVFLILSCFSLNAQWKGPIQSSYNKSINTLYVANQIDKNIVRFNLDTYKTDTLISGFTRPNGILYGTLPLGEGLIVLDTNVVKLYNLDGDFLVSQNLVGALNLDDVTYDSVGEIMYVSDRHRGYIYKVTFGPPPFFTPTIVNLITSGINKPNGLYYNHKDKFLYVTSMDSGVGLHKVDPSTKKITDIDTAFKGPIYDIGKDDQDNFYVTSWRTNYLYQFQDTFKKRTSMFLENKPAGITMASKIDELIQVCFNCNKVYRIKLHDFGALIIDDVCQNDSFETYKDVTKTLWGTFEKGNNFKLELSDAQGTFKSFTTLKTIQNEDVPGVLSGLVKGYGKDVGGNYKVRWVSTKPAIIGGEANLKVHSLPMDSKAFSTANADVCIGDSLELGTKDSSNYTYSWSPGSATTYAIRIKPIKDEKYYLTTSNSITKCVYQDSVNVALISKPDISALKKYDTICNGDSIFLGLANVGTFNYAWSPKIDLDDTSKSKITFKGNLSRSYQLKVSAGSCISIDSVHIRVLRNPVIPPLKDTFNKCYLGKKLISIIPNNQKWQLNNGLFSYRNNMLYTSDSLSGKFVLNAVDTTTRFKCSSSDSFYLNVFNKLPVVDVSFNNKNIFKSLHKFKTYDWVREGSIIKTTKDDEDSIKILVDGKYSVRVTDKNGCSAQSIELLLNTVGVSKSANNNKFKVYPNPASSHLLVESTLRIEEVVLVNLLGKRVIENVLVGKNIELNILDLEPGIYILKVKIEGDFFPYRIIKE